VPDGCEIINLGNAHEVTILELAQTIKRLTRTAGDLEVTFRPYTDFKNNYEDVRRRVPDLSKAARLLGYEPKVSLEEGLARTIDWQRRVLGLPPGMHQVPNRTGAKAGMEASATGSMLDGAARSAGAGADPADAPNPERLSNIAPLKHPRIPEPAKLEPVRSEAEEGHNSARRSSGPAPAISPVLAARGS
jgi:hypothetical protein